MSIRLLTTKLSNPPLRAKLVPRPRLLARLNEGLNYPLTLVSGSAGFGKTTALSDWIRQSRSRIAWLTLEEDDNDPTRFWSYFIAALQTLDPHLGQRALAMLHAQGQSLPRPESFLTLVLSDLDAFLEEPLSSPKSALAFVLDDYHVIRSPSIHEGITFCVEHLPAPAHLYVASRSDPPLPLAHWRGRGQLAEIRTDDLRFANDEAGVFLDRVMGVPLSPHQVEALQARTEGWVVGLQLAALAMRGRTDVLEFIAAFSGSHHYIIDYLTQEAVQRQPDAIQEFLLQTSILDRVSGALCDAVTGRTDSQAVLQALEQSNVFTIPLDDERQWYRYHHLFAEMLRQRLRQTMPERLIDLHRRASEWYEANGMPDEAVHHALAAKDLARAARLMEENANIVFWVRGETTTFLQWLDALPDEAVRAHPRLGLFHAWALLISGQLDKVEPRLEEIERSLLNSAGSSPRSELEIKSLRGQMAAIRSRVARLHNDLPRAIELSQAALDDLPEANGVLRSIVTLNLGIAYWQNGDLAAATRVLTQASALGETAGSSLVALGILGDMQAEQGHLHQAAETFQQAIDRAQEDGKPPSPMVSWAFIGMGCLFREWNDLDAAERHMQQGMEFAQQWGNADGLAWAWLQTAQLKTARGDGAGAHAALIEAEQVLRHYEVAPWTAAEVAGYRGELWIRQGNLAEAARWARERGLGVEDELSHMREPEYLAYTRWLMSQEKWEQAESFLDRLLQAAKTSGLMRRVIEILILQAQAWRGEGKATAASAALERAFALAEPEGYVRLFVDEGETLRTMSDFGLHNDERLPHLRAYVARLAAAFPDGSCEARPASEILAEPLSARELEILPLLAQGLSNREIAEKLVLSAGTVKVHLKHIYGKLAASNRTQAVARARELNLL